MARGRRPVPAAVGAAKGNTRRQRKPAVAKPLVAPADLEGLPAFMALEKQGRITAQGRRIQERTVQVISFLKPRLEAINFLKETDVGAFYRYCRYMAEWLVALEIVDKEGRYKLVKSKHVEEGMMRRHPALHDIRVNEQNMRLLEAELGMTPARRQQLMMNMAREGVQLPPGAAQAPADSGDGSLFRSAVGFLASGSTASN